MNNPVPLIPNNTIIHLVHSSNAIKLGNTLIIFDYPLQSSRLAENQTLETGFINPREIRAENVMVFVSHGHEDHFHPDIFNWHTIIPHIRYVVSSDITRIPRGTLTVIPGKSYDLDNMNIITYPSTDCGVAFSIFTGGKHIYFAGDNGFWNWDDTLPDQVFFNHALSHIDTSIPINIAFQLCDPRLKTQGAGGIYIFAERMNPELLVPIHTFDDYEFNKTAEKELEKRGFKNRFWCIDRRGAILNLD